MSQYELSSPVVSFTFDSRPPHFRKIIVAWIAFWLAVSVAWVYAIAVVVPDIIGFQTTVLAGIALLLLRQGAGS